jgi:hypothetical protein
MISAGTLRAKPVTEMSSDGVEIAAKSVSREDGNAFRLHALLEIVGEEHRVIIFVVTQVKRRQDLGDWIDD